MDVIGLAALHLLHGTVTLTQLERLAHLVQWPMLKMMSPQASSVTSLQYCTCPSSTSEQLAVNILTLTPWIEVKFAVNYTHTHTTETQRRTNTHTHTHTHTLYHIDIDIDINIDIDKDIYLEAYIYIYIFQIEIVNPRSKLTSGIEMLIPEVCVRFTCPFRIQTGPGN